MLMTPTRRANIEQIAASDYRHKNVLADTMAFLSRFRDEASTPVYIGGLAGCRGNAYDGRYYLSVEEAMEFHFPTETSTRPLCYMANCVHPDVLHQALLHPRNDTPLVRQRFQGIQANAANLSPEELDGCDHLISSSPEELADRLMTLLWDFPLKICGGCCGTNQQHMHRFAEMLAYRRDNKAW